MIYPQMLSMDTGIGPEDLANAMLDRDLWKTVVQNILARELKDDDESTESTNLWECHR